jgi:multicomponent Na+:H+ antiporter subunit G
MSALEILREVVSWVMIVGGAGFVLIGAIGSVRFPDFWARLHATSVSDSAGMILLVMGMVVQAGFSLIAAKLLLIWLFLFLTGPTSTHAAANAAWISGLRPEEGEGLTGEGPPPGRESET